MRYGPEHSEKTRSRVVEIAAGEMRSHGPNGIGVAEIMRLAGLTHGGFYAHFKSKDDLVAAAIDRMFAEAGGRLDLMVDGKSRDEALIAYINGYVSRTHRDSPQTGCPVAALSSEIHRLGRKSRLAFDRGMRGFIDRLTELVPCADAKAARAKAISLLAEMTGAVAAARAVSDPQLSDDILANASRSLRARARAQ